MTNCNDDVKDLFSALQGSKSFTEKSVQIIYYDITQCFDSLWSDHTYIDLFDNGVETSVLNTLNELSKSANILVKTHVGISDKEEIRETIMQGETPSSILCTSSIDRISKNNKEDELKYKDSVKNPIMGFVDDLLNVNECGEQTKKVNDYINDEVLKRRMQLSSDKCVMMHIGAKHNVKKRS